MRLRYSVLWMLILVFGLSGSGKLEENFKGTIEGRIVLKADKKTPLPGVEIRLLNRNWSFNRFSDANGTFKFRNLPSGRFLFKASLPGMGTYIKLFSIKPRSLRRMIVRMAATPVAGERVLVTLKDRSGKVQDAGVFWGSVRSAEDDLLSGVSVSYIDKSGNPVIVPNRGGWFQSGKLAAGNYTIVFKYPGCKVIRKSVTIKAGEYSKIDIDFKIPFLTVPTETLADRQYERRLYALSQSFLHLNNLKDKATAIENEILPDVDHAYRSGAMLKLKMSSNKKTLSFKDCDREGLDKNCVSYRLLQYYPNAEAYLMHLQYWESHNYLWVSKKTGNTLQLNSPPAFDPSGRHFVTWDLAPDPDSVEKFNVTLFSVGTGEPQKLQTFTSSFRPISVKWDKKKDGFKILSAERSTPELGNIASWLIYKSGRWERAYTQ